MVTSAAELDCDSPAFSVASSGSEGSGPRHPSGSPSASPNQRRRTGLERDKSGLDRGGNGKHKPKRVKNVKRLLRRSESVGAEDPSQSQAAASKRATVSIVSSLNAFETMLTTCHRDVKAFPNLKQKQALVVSRAKEWWSAFMINDIDDPELERLFYQGFVVKLAIRFRTRLKMSRDHIGLKIAVALWVAYFDLASDLLLIFEYNDEGNRKSGTKEAHEWMRLSISFIFISVCFQVAIARYNSHGSGWKTEVYEVFLAATLLAPMVHGYRFWIGAEAPEGSKAQLGPVVMLAFTKMVEMIFESLPEACLQTSSLMVLEEIELVHWVSLVSSILSAGFLMTDLNFIIERQKMEMAHTDTHNPVHGYLPKATGGQVRLFLAMWLFEAAYFACTIIVIAQLPWRIIAYISLLEFALVMTYKMAISEVSFDGFGQPSTGGISTSFILGTLNTLFAYLATSTIPFAHFRHPGELGPHVFGGLIAWRWFSNTAIMCVVYQQGWMTETNTGPWQGSIPNDDGMEDGMEDRPEQVFRMYLGFALAALVGTALTLCAMVPRYRRTFYQYKTAKQYHADWFNTDELYFDFHSLDEQRAAAVLSAHPDTLPLHQDVVPWVCEKAFEAEDGEGWHEDNYPGWLEEPLLKRFFFLVELLKHHKEAVAANKLEVAVIVLKAKFDLHEANLAGINSELSKEKQEASKTSRSHVEETAPGSERVNHGEERREKSTTVDFGNETPSSPLTPPTVKLPPAKLPPAKLPALDAASGRSSQKLPDVASSPSRSPDVGSSVVSLNARRNSRRDSKMRRDSRRLSRAQDFFEEQGMAVSVGSPGGDTQVGRKVGDHDGGGGSQGGGGASRRGQSLRRGSSFAKGVDAGVMVARKAVLAEPGGCVGDPQHIAGLADSLMLTMRRADRTADAIFAWYETHVPHDMPDEGVARIQAVEKERELAEKLIIALAVRLRPVSVVGSRFIRLQKVVSKLLPFGSFATFGTSTSFTSSSSLSGSGSGSGSNTRLFQSQTSNGANVSEQIVRLNESTGSLRVLDATKMEGLEDEDDGESGRGGSSRSKVAPYSDASSSGRGGNGAGAGAGIGAPRALADEGPRGVTQGPGPRAFTLSKSGSVRMASGEF